MAKKLRVGLIGVGGIAGAHFPGWDASPFAEVVALGDINPETLARVGQQRGIDRLYEDSWELIRQDDIDIIDICTPNAYHAPYAIAAIPMAFGEAFFTGGTMALIVTYRPQWCASFDDARYLPRRD